jgi:hypothetical protein
MFLQVYRRKRKSAKKINQNYMRTKPIIVEFYSKQWHTKLACFQKYFLFFQLILIWVGAINVTKGDGKKDKIPSSVA